MADNPALWRAALVQAEQLKADSIAIYQHEDREIQRIISVLGPGGSFQGGLERMVRMVSVAPYSSVFKDVNSMSQQVRRDLLRAAVSLGTAKSGIAHVEYGMSNIERRLKIATGQIGNI